MVGLKLPVNGMNHYTTVDCRICPHNWWYVAPHIINSFLESYDFSGKTVVPFATSGGSNMGKTNAALAGSCPGAKLIEGAVLNGHKTVEQLNAWAEGLKL